jgi:alpha-glucosidase
VGEIHEYDLPTWATYYGGRLDELHMPFNFSLLRVPWDAVSVRQAIDLVESSIPTGAWPNYVLGNHDEHRPATRLGRAQARVAMMMLLTLRGTPTMYYGDEIGMHDVEIPPERQQDPWGRRVQGLALGRDPQRTPMQWDGGPNAGFTAPGVQPWLPVAPDHDEINVASEMDDPRSMLSLSRQLLRLRAESPALYRGSYRPVEGTTDTFAYVRRSEGQALLVALNFADRVQRVACELGAGRVLLSTQLDRCDEGLTGDILLGPHEGCVVEVDR